MHIGWWSFSDSDAGLVSYLVHYGSFDPVVSPEEIFPALVSSVELKRAVIEISNFSRRVAEVYCSRASLGCHRDQVRVFCLFFKQMREAWLLEHRSANWRSSDNAVVYIGFRLPKYLLKVLEKNSVYRNFCESELRILIIFN